jgi:hypothetical protein
MFFYSLGKGGRKQESECVSLYAFYFSIRREGKKAKKPRMIGLPWTPLGQSLIPQAFIKHLLHAHGEEG